MPKPPTVALSAEDEPEDGADEPLDVVAVEKRARRNYDLSRIDPRVVRLVAWLLTIPGINWTDIATQAKMDMRTVAVIAATRTADMAEFRGRAAQMIALVIEACGPSLLKRAVDGKLNPFEFKQLVDAWGILSAQATVRSEHTININISQAEADLMKMIDVPPNGTPLLVSHVQDAVLMGSESQKLHALPLEAEVIPEHKDIRENEVSPPNIECEL